MTEEHAQPEEVERLFEALQRAQAASFPSSIEKMNAGAEPNMHEQALASGALRHVPYQHGLQIALGKKNLYFSASNPAVMSPEDVHSANAHGALYIRPTPEVRLVDAQVLNPSIRGEGINLPDSELDYETLCRLPIVYHLQEHRKPIRDITDAEAKEAGYLNKRQLQIILALQTEHAAAFESVLQQKFWRSLEGKAPPEQLLAFANAIWPKVLEGLRFGKITGTEGDANLLQQAVQIGNGFHNDASLLADTDIPGTADRFAIREAKPEELVACGYAANEGEAQKTLGAALKKLQKAISPTTPMLKKTWNDMTDIYGQRSFAALMQGLGKRAAALEPEKSALLTV